MKIEQPPPFMQELYARGVAFCQQHDIPLPWLRLNYQPPIIFPSPMRDRMISFDGREWHYEIVFDAFMPQVRDKEWKLIPAGAPVVWAEAPSEGEREAREQLWTRGNQFGDNPERCCLIAYALLRGEGESWSVFDADHAATGTPQAQEPPQHQLITELVPERPRRDAEPPSPEISYRVRCELCKRYVEVTVMREATEREIEPRIRRAWETMQRERCR